MRHVLVARGHECIAIASPLGAMRVIEILDLDVVIYEPHGRAGARTGFPRALRERAAARGRSLRIIAVSTQDEPPGFVTAEGLDAYVAKPFDAERLDALLVVPDRDRC